MAVLSLLAVTSDVLDAGALGAAVRADADRRAGRPGAAGAVASFVGIVRGENAGRAVLRLEYEAYEPLALKAFRRIVEEAERAWPGTALGIQHRIGTLVVGEASIVIAAASGHRGEAFAACRFAIERVKQIAPIWKHEYFEGGDVWIEGATADPDDERAWREAMRRACA